MKNKIILILFIIVLQTNAFSQYKIYKDSIYKNNIKTVLLHPENSPLSYPIINLSSNEILKLSFDDLNHDSKTQDYQYTIIHCDANWQESDLYFDDYIDGFYENYINDYQQSFNTQCDYVHYEILFPSDDITFLMSGNYIVKVYKDYEQDSIIFTHGFSVVEQKVEITAKAKPPTRGIFRETSHEIDFAIKTQNYEIKNPMQYLKVVVTQNNRRDNAICNLKPRFLNVNEISYDYDFENVMSAGNEFRYFDAKNVKFAADRTSKIEYHAPFNHFYLIDDEFNKQNSYSFHQDLNGKRFIKNDKGFESELEADYVYIHFTLKSEYENPEGGIYVSGAFTNWNCKPENKMTYNKAKKQYEAEILVKQGYYNYQYILLPNNSTKPNVTAVSGSYFNTENDYVIYVYYTDQNLQYDRLISIKIFNSLK